MVTQSTEAHNSVQPPILTLAGQVWKRRFTSQSWNKIPGKSKPVRQGASKKNIFLRNTAEATREQKARTNFSKTEPFIKAFSMFLTLKRLGKSLIKD